MKSIKTLAAIATLVAGTTAFAQDAFPTRPITIVVPYPAGGTSDNQVRMFKDDLARVLGQAIVVDNRPGASGTIAAQFVARAPADGYTLLYPNNGVVISPLLNEKAGYDALKDFKPVAQVTAVPMVLVTNKGVAGATLADFLKDAKQAQKSLMYASAGTASYGHLASARLGSMTALKLEHIPYRGEAASTLAVRTGEVQMLLTTPSSAMMGQVREGNLNLLGVASAAPSPLVQGVPTINTVVPGFVAEVWFGLLAPANTPDAVVSKLNAAVRQVMANEDLGKRLMPTGAMARVSSPAELADVMRREQAEWRDVITKHNIKAD